MQFISVVATRFVDDDNLRLAESGVAWLSALSDSHTGTGAEITY